MVGNLGVFPSKHPGSARDFSSLHSLFPAQISRVHPSLDFLLLWNWDVPGHEEHPEDPSQIHPKAHPGDPSHPNPIPWQIQQIHPTPRHRFCPSDPSILGGDSSISESPRESQRAVLEQILLCGSTQVGGTPHPGSSGVPAPLFHWESSEIVPFQLTSLRCQKNCSGHALEQFSGSW